MRRLLPTSVLSLAIFAAASATAAAGEPPGAAGAPPPRAPAGDTPPAVSMSLEDMERATGGQGISVDVLTRQDLTGASTGNTVNATTLTSGDVNFAADALDGFSGVGNFVINTGANNILQGAISVTIIPAPAS